MSGTASVGNTFQSAVTATGLQLDQNFNTLVAFLNDPTNRNNFATDGSGGTNTVVLTFSPAVAGYSAGLEITFKAALSNTAAVVINANGLGDKALVNPDGSALAAGQVTAGSVYQAAYDGTRFIFISPSGAPQVAASQAAMETATATVGFPVPATMKFHPGVAKVWGWMNGTATGTITAGSAFLTGHAVASSVRLGTGTYSIAFSTTFSSTAYPFLATGAGANGFAVRVNARDSAGVTIVSSPAGGGAGDAQEVNFAAFGDLP